MQTPEGTSVLKEISGAMVRLHKEHFGRGPTHVRSHFAGPDAVVCILQDVLLPAELKLVELEDPKSVRDARVAFQAATAKDFIAAVEEIVQRKVVSFASAIDPDANVVFENFFFERTDSAGPSDAPDED
jgi:uncharacterized protein YbcI